MDIKPNERVFLAGKTRSGKTYLAQKLLEKQDRQVIVLDNKGRFGSEEINGRLQFTWRGAILVRDFNSLYEAGKKYNRIVYRPNPELEADADEFEDVMNSFYWWIYYRQNCIVYTDEATAICSSTRILPGHNAIMKRGAELNIGCWNSSQQPVNVHNTLMSEAEHFFVFITQLKSHREKLAGFMGDSVLKTIPRNHKFFYYNPATMDEAQLMEAYSG